MSMYRHEIVAGLVRSRIIGIVREDDAERAREVAEALLAGGVRAVEVTMTTPGALALIEELVDRHTSTGMLIGVGTVLDDTVATLAVLAGARFVVSPHLRDGVVQSAHRHGAAALPGASTVDEAITAVEAGADAVKLFPAGVHGLDWFTALRSVVPPVPLVPTGGISPDHAPGWLEAGAAAIGMGGRLTQGRPDQITQRAADLLADLS